MAWLVAGLGNPGDRYATSRHNLGRMVVDELARQERERFRKARFLPAEVAEIHHGGEQLLLVKSTQFMNESGPSYAGVAKKRDVEADHVIAVHDELDIPAGTLRIKVGGGTSGHNGLKSLQRSLGTPEFVRVRVGIGRPPGRQDPADFVLESAGKRVQEDLVAWTDLAADAVRSLVADGLVVTQDRFNGQGPGR